MFDSVPSLGPYRWPIVRVRPGATTEVILCGSKYLSLSTHFIPVGRGRSVLCPCEDCALCDVLPARGFYYLPCVWDSKAAILELSSLASSHLEQHCKLLHGTLRAGLKVRLLRRSAQRPIHSEVIGEHSNVRIVDQTTFASRVLAVYNYPPCNPDEDMPDYERRIRAAAKIRSGREFDMYMKASRAGLPGQLG
jgi:hypothetical protein